MILGNWLINLKTRKLLVSSRCVESNLILRVLCTSLKILIVKGYAQQPRVDFGDTFTPIAKHDTIRLLITLAINLEWKLYHLDVKFTFLNAELKEKIYVEQLEGIKVKVCDNFVYKLNKALFSLKQALRA